MTKTVVWGGDESREGLEAGGAEVEEMSSNKVQNGLRELGNPSGMIGREGASVVRTGRV